MNFLWISGWAIPPAWLAEQALGAFPEAAHTAVSPSEAAHALQRDNHDALGGYSLGALWLLMHQKDFKRITPVILLAPIFSFAAENGEGGRVALTQLRLQRRRLRQEPKTAVVDFYRRGGLEQIAPAVGDLSSEQTANLNTELGWLEDWRAATPPPRHWLGFVGQDDPLLDAEKLQERWPELQIIPHAGHAPGPLLHAAAKEFRVKTLR